MDSSEMQKNLEAVYRDWKRALSLDEALVPNLTPPLLLSVPEEYAKARRRVIFFGQETGDWDFRPDLRRAYPEYPESHEYPQNFPHDGICSASDFLGNDSAVDVLVWGYNIFEYSRYQPLNRRSPFWRTFREVQSWPDVAVIWENLSRFHHVDGSILCASVEQQHVLAKCQRDLLARELEILKPHACLFFTGPNYDAFFSEVFSGSKISAGLNGVSERNFARVEAPLLPKCSFRTYHPGYLDRIGPDKARNLAHMKAAVEGIGSP